MKRLVIFGLVVLVCTTTASRADDLEQAIGVRPAQLFYSTDRDASTISNGCPVQVPYFGWAGATGYMADWNGDSIDDKTLSQAAVGGGWQTIVAYSSPTGDIMNTNLDVIVPAAGGEWSWLDNSRSYPIFGDVDGDKIADNGLVTDDLAVWGTTKDQLVWSAWLSNGRVGVSSGATSAHSGWSVFGVASIDTGLMGDINGDGMDDRVLFRNDFNTYVDYGIGGNYGDGSVDSTGYFGGVAGDKLGLADINGDGLDDVVVIRANVADYYDLFGYYSTAAGLSNGASPDLLGVAGTISSGDYIVFGGLGMIPEPATLALLGIGALGLIRRKR